MLVYNLNDEELEKLKKVEELLSIDYLDNKRYVTVEDLLYMIYDLTLFSEDLLEEKERLERNNDFDDGEDDYYDHYKERFLI